MAQLIALKHPVILKRFLNSHRAGSPRMVIYVAAFHKAHPAIPFRHHANATPGGPGMLQTVRRIKEILYEDYNADGLPEETRKALTAVRERFMHILQVMPYRQLVQEGYVNQLLDDYLGLLLIADEQPDPSPGGWHVDEQYMDEREYYYRHPELVKEIALQMKYLVIRQH